MANYFYKARQKDGKVISGSMEAGSRNEVVNALRRQNAFPVEVKHESEKSRDIKISLGSKKTTVKDLSIMCRQFSTIIRAGISVIECIDILRRQTENKKLKEALESIYEDVQTGVTLSDSFKSFLRYFQSC